MFIGKVIRWRLSLIILLLSIALLMLAGGVGSAQADVTIIELEPLAAGLTAPLGVTHAGDGSGRQFITEQSGQIRIVQDGNLLPTPFLDVSAKLPELNPSFDERGLLGLAFHPRYEQNGRFFIRYSTPRNGDPGEPCFGTSRGCHTEILAEYAVSTSDPNQADPDSEIILFTVDEPQFNHNAGDVAFGPDGFLYFTLGDGGGAHDGLADDPPSHGPIGNAQNIETPLGAILRINVDAPAQASETAYTIPPTNPFVGQPGLDEIYAYGLRNPFKFSFDDGPGGDGKLYLGDVGQNLFEEVNIIERGGNYGWVIREGFHCFDPFNPTSPPSTCNDFGPQGEPLVNPIVEYAHPESGFMPEGGITVIGGFVYRGTDSPNLLGKYIFGDFAQAFTIPSGTLYYIADPTGKNPEIQKFQIGLDDRPYGLFLKGFGEDEDGEIYACGSTALAPIGNTGVCARIVAFERYLLPITFK
jgi:glucose/arabinose dehydrogenase